MGLQIAAAKTRAFRAASGAIEQRLPVSWERLRVVKRSSLTATSPRTHGPLQRPRRVYARRWWLDPAIHVVRRMFGSAARAKDLCLQNLLRAAAISTSSLRRLCVDGRDKPGQARP